MSDVTGPVRTLPGAVAAVPPGTRCDQHPDRPATKRIQGETDSFGAEWHDLCDPCAAEIRAHDAADRLGVCDWCGEEANDLRNRRDFAEGLCGRIYRVCGKCVRAETERLRHDDD